MKIQLVSATSDVDNYYPNVRKSAGNLLLPQWYDRYKQSRVDLGGLHGGAEVPPPKLYYVLAKRIAEALIINKRVKLL